MKSQSRTGEYSEIAMRTDMTLIRLDLAQGLGAGSLSLDAPLRLRKGYS